MAKILRNKTNGSPEPTKAQARHNEEKRAYENRIFELQQYIGTLARTPGQIAQLERDIAALKARSDALLEALQIVASGKPMRSSYGERAMADSASYRARVMADGEIP